MGAKLLRAFAVVVSIATLVLPASTPYAQASFATFANAMAQTGPVNPNTGFPFWYKDQSGLTLDLMESADANGISAPVEAGNPFSQQIGFGAEGFWWSADATMPTAAGEAILVQAVEAAFAGESAVDGEQSAFGRIRIRVDVSDPGTYTVTYPFGQKVYSVTETGLRAINDTVDIGCFAIAGLTSCNSASPNGSTNPGFNFAAATQSGIGSFLTWDTFNLNPALTDPLLIDEGTGRRYVGTALAAAHAVKGSPTGNNFFRIEGPNIGGAGVNSIETNLFSVTGRIADHTGPAVTILGDNPATVNKGEAYTDGGATALDDFDGDVTANIQTTGLPVDISTSGAKTVTYTVTDSAFNTTVATRTVNVVNQPPVASNDSFVTAEDVQRTISTIDLLANDTDPNVGDILSVTAVGNAVNGTVSLNGDSVVFVPTTNFNGEASFEYTVSDTDNATDIGVVTIAVSPGALVGPQVVADAIAATEDTPAVIPAATLLANDAEPNGNLPLSITSVQGAVNGTVSLTGTDVTFTPNLNFVGQASFTYTVSNSINQSATGNVAVTVSPVASTPPILVDDSASTDEDVAVTVDVLANDNNVENHLPLVITGVGAAANGTVNFTTGDVTYTPNANFNGTDSFTYTVADQILQTSTATVNVTINPIQDIPTVVTVADQTVDVGTPINLTVSASDPDGDALTFSLINPPAGATIDGATGAFSFTPSVDGITPITIEVSDGTNPPVSSSFNITANVVVIMAVSNVQIANVGTTTATITWTASTPSTGRVFFDKNKNKLIRARQSTLRAIGTSADGINYSATLFGLEPNKRYFFQVSATAPNGTSSNSEIIEIRTAR